MPFDYARVCDLVELSTIEKVGKKYVWPLAALAHAEKKIILRNHIAGQPLPFYAHRTILRNLPKKTHAKRKNLSLPNFPELGFNGFRLKSAVPFPKVSTRLFAPPALRMESIDPQPSGLLGTPSEN